ncbi:hypothetical protein ACX0HA_07485 [Flavobacterium hauense]
MTSRLKAIYLLFILSLFISCKENTNSIIYNEDIVKILAEYDYENGIPPPPNFPDIFIKTSDNKLCITTLEKTYHIYDNYYKTQHLDFKSFLFDIMNQRKRLRANETENFMECFQPDEKIIQEYRRIGFDKLLDNHCIETEDRFKLNNQQSYQYPQLLTFGYICYLNNYKLVTDDYIGAYSIYKLRLDLN